MPPCEYPLKKRYLCFLTCILLFRRMAKKTEVPFFYLETISLTKLYAKYLPTIGILRPIPNAFGETRKIGGV